MRDLSAGRFAAVCRGRGGGDVVILTQVHAKGSAAPVAEMDIRGDAIDDIIYVLTQARDQRNRERGRKAGGLS